MEIVEKQVEKIKEVPCGYYDGCCDGYYGYGRRGYGYGNWNSPYASRGVAGAGLGLN